jgi:hypothetical protein
MYCRANNLDELTIFFLRQVLLAAFLVQFANDLQRLHDIAAFAAFMQQQGQHLSAEELRVLHAFLLAMIVSEAGGGFPAGGGGGGEGGATGTASSHVIVPVSGASKRTQGERVASASFRSESLTDLRRGAKHLRSVHLTYFSAGSHHNDHHGHRVRLTALHRQRDRHVHHRRQERWNRDARG